MAVLHSSFDLSTPSSAPARWVSTTAPTPKLRDSCDACASSKVKCHKEKPTCSRCAKEASLANTSSLNGLVESMKISLFSALTNLNTDLDDFFGSPLSFSISETTEAADPDLLGHSRFFSGEIGSSSNGAAALVLSDYTLSVFERLPSLSTPHSPPNSRACPRKDERSYQGLGMVFNRT
ncbi:uncharacterized protein BDR25DRAFT_316063 [Lindgomyces ingoldianus]|uniref:Uncharacterized protein n=1 Tax=Lindgomyces ingoldianus TaxID=673940 RepID=A0ACB6QNR8_9PLEO|nr:uncharacterized protein BDR25DRAFT_316063 [Lindgomyces ingoldianus]KAF2468603.1 hypothetical protein BDR25DRAFT_316063 [Lindgomyces ingoldianus]